MTGNALDKIPKGLFQDAGDKGKDAPKKIESAFQAEAADLLGKQAIYGKYKAESPPAKGDIHAAGDKNMPGIVLANVGEGDRNFKMAPKKADRFEAVVAAAGENAPIKRNPAA